MSAGASDGRIQTTIPPPRWLKPANKVLIVLLRMGVPISRHESPVVLTVPGRKSGKPRSTPIAYAPWTSKLS